MHVHGVALIEFTNRLLESCGLSDQHKCIAPLKTYLRKITLVAFDSDRNIMKVHSRAFPQLWRNITRNPAKSVFMSLNNTYSQVLQYQLNSL